MSCGRRAAGSIGAIHNCSPAVRSAPRRRRRCGDLDDFWNRAFPDPQILGGYPTSLAPLMEPLRQAATRPYPPPVDWFGINHYSPIYAKADPTAPLGLAWADAPPGVPRSPIGWQVDPAAFRDTLLDAHERYGCRSMSRERRLRRREAGCGR